MSIVIQPKSTLALSEFLEIHGLTLMVRETGASKWEASFEPEVFEFERYDQNEGDIFSELIILGDTSLEAIDNLCEHLSGHDNLHIDIGDAEENLVSLELHYTAVEHDQE